MISHGPCPTCGGTNASKVDDATADDLAAAWAREGLHGSNTSASCIREYIVQDLKVSHVEFMRCADCSVEYAVPMRSWTAEHYPSQYHGIGFDQRVALETLSKSPPLRVLEIGFGDGCFLDQAAALGHRVTGIDFSATQVSAARDRALDVHAADLKDLATLYGRQEFEAVAMFQVIEHLENPAAFFSDLSHLVADDARLFVGCPSNLRYTRRWQHPHRVGQSDFWDFPPQHTLRWNGEALRRFLPQHGWRVETLAYEPFSPFAAAAHMTAICGTAQGWYGNAWHRRLAVGHWLFNALVTRFIRPTTGIRMAVIAHRETLASLGQAPLPPRSVKNACN